MEFYSAIKEWTCSIFRDMDGTRNCHIGWNISERETQISYNIAYKCNLEKQYRWTYLQSWNWDTDMENKHTDTKGRRDGGLN